MNLTISKEEVQQRQGSFISLAQMMHYGLYSLDI